MKNRLLIIIILVAVLSLAALRPAEALEIKFDQKIRVGDLELYFYDIEDSRCPLDVTCIWKGNVTAMIHVKNQTHKIAGYFTPGYTLTYITPYNVTLVDIQPYPISTEKSDYVATLDISKSETTPRPTDFRETNSENSLVIILIESIGAILIVLFIIFYVIKKRITKKSLEEKK